MASNQDAFDPFAIDHREPAPPPDRQIVSLGRVPLQTLRPDQLVRGIYRIGRCLQRVSRNNDGYRILDLVDGPTALRCYGWRTELVQAPALADGAIVEATFLTYDYQGSVRGRLFGVDLVANPSPEDVIATLPSSLCPVPGVVDQLRDVVCSIHEPLLREFVGRVFGDYAFARRYFSAPASFGDHHAVPGGQARHAIEMALDASRSTTLALRDRDTSVVLALFHDVGKIETHEPTQRSRIMHRLINHEALTLYLVAEHLKWLDQRWPDGARALIVGWVPAAARNDRDGQPVTYAPRDLVRGLDRASRAAAMQSEHVPATGGLVELSRKRAIWSPSPPPSADAPAPTLGQQSDATQASR